MPELDGPQTVTQIRAICQSANVRQPFIACVTAYDGEIFKRAASDAGMDRFYTKPLTMENIKEILEVFRADK